MEELKELLEEIREGKERAEELMNHSERLGADDMYNINKGYLMACSDFERRAEEILNEVI